MPHLLLENFRSLPALLRFGLPAIIGLAVDLWTKALAEAHLKSGGVVRFIPGWLHFDYTENFGAVFGLGQGKRALFLVASIAAVGFLVYLFATSDRQRVYQFILGLLLAGVLGNMYDRVVLGHVRDMIYALPGWQWPGNWSIPLINYPGVGDRAVFPWIFNVADSLLCVGVTLMILYSLFLPPRQARAEKATAGRENPVRQSDARVDQRA